MLQEEGGQLLLRKQGQNDQVRGLNEAGIMNILYNTELNGGTSHFAVGSQKIQRDRTDLGLISSLVDTSSSFPRTNCGPGGPEAAQHQAQINPCTCPVPSSHLLKLGWGRARAGLTIAAGLLLEPSSPPALCGARWASHGVFSLSGWRALSSTLAWGWVWGDGGWLLGAAGWLFSFLFCLFRLDVPPLVVAPLRHDGKRGFVVPVALVVTSAWCIVAGFSLFPSRGFVCKRTWERDAAEHLPPPCPAA